MNENNQIEEDININIIYPQFLSPDNVIDKTEEIDNFLCCLCHGIVCEPVFDKSCHLFCKRCIKLHLSKNNKCPIDNNLLKFEELTDMILIQTLLNNKKIYCNHKKEGCNWNGFYKDYKTHLNTECLKECLYCSNEGCSQKILRENYNEHLKKCSFRKVLCNECKIEILHNKLEEHKKICPKIKINCPHCKKSLQRESIENHIKNECPNTLIECNFKKYGCNEKYKRIEFNNKMKENIEKHFLLGMNYLEDNIKKLNNDIENFNKYKKDTEKTLNDYMVSMTQIANNFTVLNNRINALEGIVKMDNNMMNNSYLGKKRKNIINNSNFIHNNYNIEEGEINNNNNNNKDDNSHNNNYRNNHFFEDQVPFSSNLYVNNNNVNNNNINNNINNNNNNNNLYHKDFQNKHTNNNNNYNIFNNNNSNSIFDLNHLAKGLSIYEHNKIFLKESKTLSHKYVFLNNQFDIYYKDQKEKSFKVKIPTDTVWFAFGLCDKEKVISNKEIFSSENKNFNNGSFLVSTNGFSWNCANEFENNKEITFPKSRSGFYKVVFSPKNKELNFYENNNMIPFTVLHMVTPVTGNTKLTPCLVFLHEGDGCEVNIENFSK